MVRLSFRVCPLAIVLCVVAMTASSLFFNASSVYAASNVVLLDNHSGYLASNGKYHVVGEVENQGTTAAWNPWVYIRFKDSHGLNITSWTTSVMLWVILPGRKLPFEFELYDADLSAKVYSYEIYNITFSDTFDKPLGLVITSHGWSITPGNVTVIGTVKNVGTEAARNLYVACTFYDGDGRVVGAESVRVVDRLDSQQEASFTIVEDTGPGRESLYTRYEFAAECNEYVLVPEHPSQTFLTILIFTLTAFALIKKKGHQQT